MGSTSCVKNPMRPGRSRKFQISYTHCARKSWARSVIPLTSKKVVTARRLGFLCLRSCFGLGCKPTFKTKREKTKSGPDQCLSTCPSLRAPEIGSRSPSRRHMSQKQHPLLSIRDSRTYTRRNRTPLSPRETTVKRAPFILVISMPPPSRGRAETNSKSYTFNPDQ